MCQHKMATANKQQFLQMNTERRQSLDSNDMRPFLYSRITGLARPSVRLYVPHWVHNWKTKKNQNWHERSAGEE